ncbi:MAG TPA: hypothetical protein VFW42_03455 [Fluviicoccus sp.]|nr:hypothetical protein [Fluviicoccus sp.]
MLFFTPKAMLATRIINPDRASHLSMLLSPDFSQLRSWVILRWRVIQVVAIYCRHPNAHFLTRDFHWYRTQELSKAPCLKCGHSFKLLKISQLTRNSSV